MSAVSARSLTGPSARSWARFTCRSSMCPRSTRSAFTSPRACSASSALPARPLRSARAASPSRPPSPESSTGTLGVHDGVNARPTAGGTTSRSSLACSDEPFRVPEPFSTSPASPRSTAASRAFSSPLPRTESCSGPCSIPETEARPSRRPSNAPVGPAYRPPARSSRLVSATRRASSPLPWTSRTAPRSRVKLSTTKVKGSGPDDGWGGFGFRAATARVRFIPSSSAVSHSSGCSMRTTLRCTVLRISGRNPTRISSRSTCATRSPSGVSRVTSRRTMCPPWISSFPAVSFPASASLAARSPNARTRALPPAVWT